MNERLQMIRSRITEYWNRFSNKQKIWIAATIFFLLISTSLFVYFVSKPNMVPLFTGTLTEQDIGQIKTELDAEGYKNYQIVGGNVLVPEKDKYTEAANLAAKGIPKSDGVKLDIFSQNIGMGMTDRQFTVVERDAMQNQLADLLKTVDGVRGAKVILTMPQQSVFVQPNDSQNKASASIVVDVDPGKQLDDPQIRALYNLVSKSVPNLPTDNIVIMNQYSQMLELTDNQKDGGNALTQYDQERQIQKGVELDIQRNLQNMLGTILGQDKVYVYTYVKLNFDKIQTEKNLVQPVDPQTNQGITISEQKIAESYTGKGAQAGGQAGTGQTSIPQYAGASSSGDSTYEKTQDSVNREVNRIKQSITSQPYQMDDITINVGVEPPNPANPASLTPQTQAEIQRLIGNVVRASLPQGNQLTPQQLNNKISVFPQAFNGKQTIPATTNWNTIILYSIIGLVVLAAGLTAFILIRRRKRADEEIVDETPKLPVDIPEIEYEEGEDAVVRKQLEKLAKQKPEEFVNLLRSWLADE
ncbi:flagellar basal-body MS-ring/collar protein FliF [Aneurinibacillus sp. Ricciae_BoGa-3]|uniref:flagellar basal-body MS-ring/collar protein FliF n=1 Tax=Aneurinibacillus sp. Ricciae_BoGa-3 TaxID=3022697 RepID=UPI002340C6A6|nr:flagellar basal-body MS-ring/collar protein FliF [Aneurinibacillus sp. Ricciae_BoGa-3]WCK52901.1 flagellar basal-body MS-ring/collar protein FliF [Aneurinibacillus sp. Ricciae_BoGa-3]